MRDRIDTTWQPSAAGSKIPKALIPTVSLIPFGIRYNSVTVNHMTLEFRTHTCLKPAVMIAGYMVDVGSVPTDYSAGR